MKLYIPILAVATIMNPCNAQKKNMNNTLRYPETKKINHVDTYFGENVNDPYRWLEDDQAADTKDWVQREVAFTNAYLDQIPFRENIKNQLREIWNYEKISAPFKEGDYTYFYKNDGLQAQSVLYRTDKNGKTEVFLDPNQFSEKGTTSLSGVSFNKKEICWLIRFPKAVAIGTKSSSWMSLPRKSWTNRLYLNLVVLLG